MENSKKLFFVFILGAHLPALEASCGLALKGELGKLTNNSKKTIRIADLPAVYDLALPSETVAQIKAHPLFDKLKKFRDKKQRIVLDSYIRKGESLDPKNPDNNHLGETTQGRFLQKVVDELTAYDPKSKDTEELRVQTDIVDRFESPTDQNTPVAKITKESDFEMTDLKQANPSMGPQHKVQLRQALGIDPAKVVLSIYADRFGTQSRLQVQDFIRNVKPPDVIYFTKGGREVKDLDIETLKAKYEPQGYKVMKLSQVGPLTYKTFPKLLVVNDMRGKVPYLHALANVALVEGPINFFEPMSVGTPTYWVNLSEDTYSQTRLKEMVTNANRTGIFATADSGKELSNFYKETKDKEIKEAPLVTERNGTRALDNVLDDLEKVISRLSP